MAHGGFRLGAGRPRLPEAEAAAGTISERATEIQALLDNSGFQDDYLALRLVFIRKTRANVGHEAARLIKDYAGEENAAKEALKALQHPPQVVSREDALSILLHVDLSRQQYQNLRTLINSSAQFKNLLPSYELVRLYKATASPIKDLALYTERRTEVKLQELLNHTAERAVLSNEANINASVSGRRRRVVDCEFLITWGMDGASEYAQFQQRHKRAENIGTDIISWLNVYFNLLSEIPAGKSDKSLFAVVVNPVTLEIKKGACLWKNPAVQSHLFVRPLVLEFEKETEGYVKGYEDNPFCIHVFCSDIFEHKNRMKAYIDAQINELEPIDVELEGGKVLRIQFRMLASMIDGKVFCFFVNRPFSSCPICKADKNDLRTRYAECVGTARFRPCLAALIYGLQVLHAWINFANHLIKIPLRMARDEAEADAAEAGLNYDECKQIGKEAWNARLAQIQHDFLQCDLHLGLTVTGNFARMLFGPKRDLFERVVGIDRRIIDRFRIILICVNTTRFKLKPVEFQAFCDETRDLYLELYSDYPLTPTLHKVLEHAVQVQQATGQILGEISEGAAESKHRIRKEIRRFRARKTSKKDNLTDIMDRCLHLSDPKLSLKYSSCVTKYRNARRRHVLGQIPQEAEDLLNIGGDLPPPVNASRTRATRGRNNPDAPDENPNLAPEDDPQIVDNNDQEQPDMEEVENDPSDDEVDVTDDDDTDEDLTDDDLNYEEDMFMDE